MKILVADDSRMFRAILQAMLTQLGHEVVAASDGEQAWRLLQPNDGPALAILDWEMPVLSGIEVCRAVRQSGHKVYIIMFTAKCAPEDFAEARQAGADDYVCKEEFDPLKQLGDRLKVAACHLQKDGS